MHGQNFIAGKLSGEGKNTLQASKPGTGEVLPGSFTEASSIEPAAPPPCRSQPCPLAVFGASNFPLAFSTTGGDTASAFALVDRHLHLPDATCHKFPYCSRHLLVFESS